MSQGLALLDEALDLARQEKSALEEGEYDEAIGMAQKRVDITDQAWNFLQTTEHEPYRKRLLELADLQKQLTELATSARNAVRQRMNRSRQEKKRMQGYHLAVGQALQ